MEYRNISSIGLNMEKIGISHSQTSTYRATQLSLGLVIKQPRYQNGIDCDI